jgi:hypothetical protein
MTLDVFAQDGLSRLVRRAGGQTTCCGFAILAALEHHSDATELVAQYMVNDRARLYLLWLLPYPQHEHELIALQAMVGIPLRNLELLLRWPSCPFAYELELEDLGPGAWS